LTLTVAVQDTPGIHRSLLLFFVAQALQQLQRSFLPCGNSTFFDVRYFPFVVSRSLSHSRDSLFALFALLLISVSLFRIQGFYNEIRLTIITVDYSVRETRYPDAAKTVAEIQTHRHFHQIPDIARCLSWLSCPCSGSRSSCSSRQKEYETFIFAVFSRGNALWPLFPLACALIRPPTMLLFLPVSAMR
jgi:hypothetical protein